MENKVNQLTDKEKI